MVWTDSSSATQTNDISSTVFCLVTIVNIYTNNNLQNEQRINLHAASKLKTVI